MVNIRMRTLTFNDMFIVEVKGHFAVTHVKVHTGRFDNVPCNGDVMGSWFLRKTLWPAF